MRMAMKKKMLKEKSYSASESAMAAAAEPEESGRRAYSRAATSRRAAYSPQADEPEASGRRAATSNAQRMDSGSENMASNSKTANKNQIREMRQTRASKNRSGAGSAAIQRRVSKPLVAACTMLLTVMLTLSLIGASASPIAIAAGSGVTASSLTNNNIGKHPLHALLSWDATGENLQNGGRFNWGAAVTGDYVPWTDYSGAGIVSNKVVVDAITPRYIDNVINSVQNDAGGETILEQSPIFSYKRETRIVDGVTYTIYVDTNGNQVYFDEVAQSIALKYGFREGKELVFNINDEGTAARVWADAVLFTQHIGPAESIPFVSNFDTGKYIKDTGLVPDTTMFACEKGQYVFRTNLKEGEEGKVVYNGEDGKYGIWERCDDNSKDGDPDYIQQDGKAKKYGHFFVNDNGSYYYHTDTKIASTDKNGAVESYTTPGYSGAAAHVVRYSLYDPDAKQILDKDAGGTLDIHGPVYRGNYFIENGRYEGWGSTSAYGGAKLMGQYITVRLNCDWTAKEIKTNIYTVEGKTTTFDFVKTGESDNAYKTENDAYVKTKDAEEKKYFDKQTIGDYTLFYDASSIPFGTGNTEFNPYNELCAFSNGRINVPVGSYIVLDLNGHTIDRALDATYDENANDSAYQFFGSVFAVNEYARLEVYDGTAFENASDTHISGANKDKPESNYGADGGLTTDQKGTITGGYVTHQSKKDGGNGRTGEGNKTETQGDANAKDNLKLNIKDVDTRSDFAASISDNDQAKGAAVHLFGHSDFVLHSGTICGNNAASQYGGAVYLLTNSSMTMFDGYVINNQAYRIGGGIYLADTSASVLTMYNGVIGYNYGGAGKLKIDESNDLRENGLAQLRAIENYGGGIALRTKAYCNLYGGELVGNYSYGPGAGMYIQGTAVGTLAGITIKGNHTYGAPGGQGGSFAPYGGGGGIFVGGTGARIGFRGALQIVDNFRDYIVKNNGTKAKNGENAEIPIGEYDYYVVKLDSPTEPNHQGITNIAFVSTKGEDTRADNLFLPMQEMTKNTIPANPYADNNSSNQYGVNDGAPVSENYNANWDSNSVIIISGPLIEKGIVANIGITMQAATSHFNADDKTDKKLNEDGATLSSENIKLVFTNQYTAKGDSQHNDLDAHYFFTSDNPDYSITMVDGEAKLHKDAPAETDLTWVVEGNGIDADTKADATGAPVLSTLRVIVNADGELAYWYKNPNRAVSGPFQSELAKVDGSTQIDGDAVELSTTVKTKNLLDILNDSFVATGGSLDFEYSMLNVTSVAVYSGTPTFSATGVTGTQLAYWKVTGNGDSFGINSTFYTSNFRFKLGEQDFQFDNHNENAAGQTVAKDNPMFKAIKATDESLSYAGLYSFLYQSTQLYSNPTFKINIKQVGIEATRSCFFDGGDVTKREPVPWTKGADWTWNIGEDMTKNREPNAPYFLYRGDYYYPVLSADYAANTTGEALIEAYEKLHQQGEIAETGSDYVRNRITENTFFAKEVYIRVVNPEKTGDCLFIRKSAFNGYVLDFRYANEYFGKTADNMKRDVHFGAHDGGGVEYKTMHKKPGSTVAEGQYVDGVKHAGTYLVTFVASSNGLADDTGVYFASNNFAFNAEVRLLVEAANAEVQLTDNARNNLVYSGALYEDRQIAEFDNTSDTKIIPVNDNAVIFRYFLYNDPAIWTEGNIPSLDDLLQDEMPEGFSLVEGVVAQKYKEDGTPNVIPGEMQEPLNARTYIVVVTLDLDMNYEEYDYSFTKDAAHLVPIKIDDEKQSYVWAYWFTIDPAEINPFETKTVVENGNTEISITKDKYFNGESYGYEYTKGAFNEGAFSAQANLPTEILFRGGASETKLVSGQDYDVEFVGFNEVNAPESEQFNFLDASVGLDSASSAPAVDGYKFGDYNLAVKITFGGTNQNYKNTPAAAGEADAIGTAYEDESGAFYVYFRILPVIVTASANISYTYDGGSYDRGRFLPAVGSFDDWYESIFFLAQDSITTSQELLENQKQDIDSWTSADGSRTLKDLWGGLQDTHTVGGAEGNYTDKTFYQQRYYVSNVNVQYSNSEFIDNGVKLGIGLYAFQTGNANYQVSSYHLTTMDYDDKTSIEDAPEKPGAIWLLTVGNTQSFVETNDDDTAATNFIVSAASYLDVNITQKDITAGDVKVTLNGEEYNAEAIQEYPYSGYGYRPTVTLSYDVQVPTQAAGAHATKSVTINTISIKSDGNCDEGNYDSFITYSNNVQTSTDVLPASVMITAAKTEISKGKFSQNFYNSRTLNFKIVPAHIKVTIVGDHIFTYDRKEHPVKLNYANTTDYSTYRSLMEGATDFVAPVPIEQTEVNVLYGEVGEDNQVPMGDGDRRNFVSTAPINAGRYRVAVHINSANFIYVESDYKEGEDFAMDSINGAKDILTYNKTPDGKDTDIIINPAIAYIGPGAEAVTEGHEIVNQFTYNRTIQVPSVLRTNICNVSYSGSAWVLNFDNNVVPASSSGDYTVQYAKDADGDPDLGALDPNGFENAGTYWMILDMSSENFIWGGYNADEGTEITDPKFPHKELSNKRLAVKYTILPSQVLLKPVESISGATYPEGKGTLHFTYDGVKHEVGVVLSSLNLTPLSTEYQLNKIEFVGVKPSFAETSEDKYLSIYAGTYRFTVTFTDAAKNNYVWSAVDGDWTDYNPTPNSVIVKHGAETNDGNKIVFVDPKAGTVTITYTIDKARVYIDSIDSKLYNRGEQDDINVNFKNEVETNSKVPTKYGVAFKVSDEKNQWLYQPYDPSVEGSVANKINARLGDNDKPYYAGNYDATITLSGDDANNFYLVQQESYKSDRNIEKSSEKTAGKTADYSDKVAGADGKSAVALFVIEALGVYATQTLPSVMFDNKDHFMGDPYGIDADAGRYGGIGPWTISYSSLNGETPVDGISYNIKFENEKYLVVIKMGGYSHGSAVKTLDPDAIYLQIKGEDDVAKKINATDDVSDAFAQIKALGLFTNADTYEYTLTFEFANFFYAGELNDENLLPKVKPLSFTITPATIGPGTLANKTFNNAKQDADFADDSFVAVGDTKFDESIYSILKGYNDTEPDSGFTFSYAAEPGNARLVDGKPFNAGTYTVTAKLASGNFSFSGSDTATMTFIIDPFDITGLGDDAFQVTLPDTRYTGMPMKTYISQVEVKIGESMVTLVLLSSDATDGKLQLGKDGYDFSIASYDSNVNVVLNTDASQTPLPSAIARIAGSNNFTGELSRKFTILPREIHVNINNNMGNVYGVYPNSGADKPSNLGDVRNTDWTFDGDDSMKSSDELTAMIEASVNMTYGGDDTAIQEAIEAFEKLNGASADQFIYEGDNLYVALHIYHGAYNNTKSGAEHNDLLVGKWPIIGSYTNNNYKVSFSGGYVASGAPAVADDSDRDDAVYGCYEVVQRDILITPADLNIIYGNAEHEYMNNAVTDGTQLYWTASSNYAGDAILAEDLTEITSGIRLEIADKDKHLSKSGWLVVGTYFIKVINIEDTIGKLGDDGRASSVKGCYTIKGAGTWVDGAMGAAVEAVAMGIGGTYTVSPRSITVQITPGKMGYEYDKEEPNGTRDILKYMLEVAKKQEDGSSYTYEDLMSLINETSFATAREGVEGASYTEDDWEDLNLSFIKDAGVDAVSYSVIPGYENSNYTVTFEGYSNSVTISPRKIIVHINDQSIVYGEEVIVGTEEGKEANWYAMLSKNSTYWNEELYGGDDKLDDRIAKGRLEDDNLSLIISKEFGANVGIYYLSGTCANNNYEVTFEGAWTEEQSTTTDKDGDPEDLTAGKYEITVRPVTVTVYGQSGVYGAGQHLSIGATENTHWSAEQGTIGNGEHKGVVNNDSLGIKITIVYDSLNEKSNQLNVGWYSVRVSYTNANYTVTFKGDNSKLASAEYVDGYETHNTTTVTDSTKEAKDGEVKAYDVSNIYCVYARLISISVNPQNVPYNGKAPVLHQGASWWTANNVINGEMPAILSGDQIDFEKAILLEFVEPTEGDKMYDVWKQWGMWSAGLYEGKSGIKATLNEKAEGVDKNIFTNYKLNDGESRVLGALRINPVDISVIYDGPTECVYNKAKPFNIETKKYKVVDGTVYELYKVNEEKPTDGKELLDFTFDYEGEDYGAGNHRIMGRWTNDDHSPNYNVTFNPATYKILKRELKVTIEDQYAIYGETMWTGENWWLDNEDIHGTQTPNPKYWTVKVTNYNKDYLGGDTIYWVNEDDRKVLNIRPVIGAQQGANAGTYAIGGTWDSSNDDYNVTFVGSWNETEEGLNDGTGGTYTIHQRAIVVHINDQGGVYGGNSFGTAVDQSMGNDAEHGGYYVVGFDADAQKGICKEHECTAPKEPYVVASDNLNIALTLGDVSAPGTYDIKGECRNTNYAVTWVGGRQTEDGEFKDRFEFNVGHFAIQKRKVTVTIQDQSIAYGRLKNGLTTGFLTDTTPDGRASGYSASATNDSVNPNAFVSADNVHVELSVMVIYDGYTGSYNQAGRYAIIVKIYEGYNSGSDKGTLIYSSLGSEQGTVELSDKYDLTVEGNYTDEDFVKAEYKNNDTVFGKTGAYDVTKLSLVVTVANKSSIYGESLETLTYDLSDIMPEDRQAIEDGRLVKLEISDKKFNDWDFEQAYLCAGSYNITAALDDATINNNYAVVFRTQNGADYKTDDGEKITAMYTVTKRMLAINVTYLNSVYGEALQRFTATLSPVGDITGEPILQIDRENSLDRPLGINFEIVGESSPANHSTTGYLKVGVYPIIGSWESETYSNYDVQFTGVWTEANTETWLEQADENQTMYQEVKDGAHGALDRKAGVYTVSKRPIDIRLGVDGEEPASEYGDEIIHFADDINTGKTWGVRYEEPTTGRGRVSKDDKTDDIVFEMTTTAYRGASATTYPITVKEGSDVGGDNNNYEIRFISGTYTIKPREMSVSLTAKDPKVEESGFSCAVDVYGTKYNQEDKFTYEFKRTHPQGADDSFYNGEDVELVIKPWKNALAQDAELTATGFYPVGTYSLALSAKNDPNYSFTSMEGSNVRYKVTARPITLFLNDQSSVYGNGVDVCQNEYKNNDTPWGWKVVSELGIVEGKDEYEDNRDDLGVTITRSESSNIHFKEGGYTLNATIDNRNYDLTIVGGGEGDIEGYERSYGIYTIKKRLIRIRIYNQYSIYGETISVKSELTSYQVVTPNDGDKFYSLMGGESAFITLNIFTMKGEDVVWYTSDGSSDFTGIIDRGEYHIGVQNIGNPDYDVEVEEDYLPDVSDTAARNKLDLISKYPDDFGETTTLKTIEVKNPVISAELAAANNATYFVTIRPVTIKIHDQSGVYGDYLTLNSSDEGVSPAYTIDLGKYLGSYVTTGQPFVGGYKATFDLVTTAIKESDVTGDDPIGQTMGWSRDVGTYPIFGEKYHVFVEGEEKFDEDAAKLSHNYQFNFEGSYDEDIKYSSGTTFKKGMAGTYTVEKRQITLTARDSSATYGGTDKDVFVLIPKPNDDNYQAVANNSKVNTDGIETRGPILDVDDLHIYLEIEYNEAEHLSSAHALKVGEYTLKLKFTENANYDITAIDGKFEVTVRGASILIGQRAAEEAYLAEIPNGWSEKDTGMYTLSNALPGDVIEFTMTTVAKRGNSVGQYTLSGAIGASGADNDNANYSVTFTDGTFEITRKRVDVTLSDQFSEYGEMPSVNNSAKWSLSDGWNMDGDFSNEGDTAESLGITLSTSATDKTDVGRYQILGSYDMNGETGKNYDLQFVGSWGVSEGMGNNGGTLNITPRVIFVVIKAQTIIYRDDTAVDQYAWYAWRKGNVATWTEEHDSTVNDHGVLGPKDGLDALRVYLTKGNATDMDTYGPNTGAGTYVGTYAIVGSHTATNYSITFAYEREEKEAFDYSSVENSEDGIFTINPYDITIDILDLGNDSPVRYGGTDYVKNGGKLYFGAELVNDMGIIWKYADDMGGKAFLSTELGYLSFRLGGVFSSETYAFVGQHPIVGYWGYGLDDKNATDYRMQFNYKVTFKGNWTDYLNTSNKAYGYEALYKNEGKTANNTCGVMKLSYAQIDQASYDQSYEEGKSNGNWHGLNWNRESAFSGNNPENPKHSMEVGAKDLAFAGNVTFGGNSVSFGGVNNTKLAEAAIVTYGNLRQDGSLIAWEDAGKAPEQQDVGKWTVDVTVKAPYHEDRTFTLTLTITRINITIYLTGEEISIPYGVFELRDGEVIPVDPKGQTLNDLLKAALFGAYAENKYLDKDRRGGPIVSTGTDEQASNPDDIVAYLLDSADVQVSISTRINDASTGGFLIANRYVLTISAGENMDIRFGSEYNNVHVTQRELAANWTPGYEAKEQRPYKDDASKTEYVYNFEHKDVSVVPRVADGGILVGDKVLLNDDGISEFSFIIYKLNNGGEIAVTGNVMRDVGTYKIVILNNITPTPGKNEDIGNYKTPVDEYVYVTILRAEVTIVIKDQTSEYGDPVALKQDDDWWYVKTGNWEQDLPDGSHPDMIPDTEEPLSSLGISLSFAEGDDPFDHGTYAIYGKAANTNYDVVFVGSYGSKDYDGGEQGSYEITPRKVLVKVNSFSFVYGADINASTNLAVDTNQYTFMHVTSFGADGAERPEEIAVLPRDMEKTGFGISVRNGNYTTDTGYLKVGTYDVDYKWSDDNYEVMFADKDGHKQNSGAYSVKVNVDKAPLNITIHGRQVSYGEVRPAMPQNYNITGLAKKDEAYYIGKGLDRPDFIRFELRNSRTGEELKDFDESVDMKYRFDPVGEYIIIGTSIAGDDIGDNYAVTFAGEWVANGGNYDSDQYVGKAGKYEVIPRLLTIMIGNVESEYGDVIPDRDIPFELATGSDGESLLAGDDTKEGLNLTFITGAIIRGEGPNRTAKVGQYEITGATCGNNNYKIDGAFKGMYTINPRRITIEVFDMSHPYGDDHLAYLAAAAFDLNWTAHRSEGKEGKGIVYDDDAIIDQIKLTVSGISDRSTVNDYTLFYEQKGTDSNYVITGYTAATYTITPRKVQLFLKGQTGEYGDPHEASSNASFFEFTLRESASNKPTQAVVFDDDKLLTTLRLFFVNALNEETPVGEYLIDAVFTDDNYEVSVTGEMTQGDRRYGKYTVTKRRIIITLGAKQESEYGDEVLPDSAYGVGWTARRPDGAKGDAIVNGDHLSLVLTVLDRDGKAVDSTYPVDKYALLIASTDFNDNYEVSYEAEVGGAFDGTVSGHAGATLAVYSIIPRKIVVEFGGTSEYGDDIEVHDISYRAEGKEGPAVVNGDNLGYNWAWKNGDPTAHGFADKGEYALTLSTESDPKFAAARENYDIIAAEGSKYVVTPRKVTVKVTDSGRTYGDPFVSPDITERLEVSRTTPGAQGAAILNDDIKFFSLSVIDGDEIAMTDGRPYYAGVYNYDLTFNDNENYEVSVEYGHYKVSPKPVTVNIDTKTTKYSENILDLTYAEVEGVIAGDNLNIMLNVVWGTDDLDPAYHNAGRYAIKGVWDNPNYDVTFHGDMGEFGAYVIEKADNMFTKEYDGNGTVYLGDDYRDGDLPTALWGNDSVRYEYYLDEAMTQRADFDGILNATEGVYYVKAIVDEGLNWTDAVTTFSVHVVNTLGFSDGLDITAYVCIYASQFLILVGALIFVRRKKDKNAKTNTSKAGN